ncbi:MAG: hypothetical protein H6937_11240 [Burkholderiales bacterium]|nr:hypothetical protein [Burkholderiales bacterium]
MFYGYKDHANVDQGAKLITASKVISTEVHHSQILEELLQSPEMGGADVFPNSTYRSQAHLSASGHTSQIHEKGARNIHSRKHKNPTTKRNHGYVRGSSLYSVR